MSVLHDKTTRRILPRWRSSKLATNSADFLSLKAPPKVIANVDKQLQEQQEQFSNAPSLGTAAEMLSVALLDGQYKVAKEAASYILCHEETAPRTLLELAISTTNDQPAFTHTARTQRDVVATTRRLLRLQPRNPVLWSDMARHYASQGEKTEALRCMNVALTLAPNHRWMLRTAARFLTHQGNPIGAHKLLTNHPQTKMDPWLLAAELACAQVAGRPPKFWRQAMDILRFESFAPLHTTELATAIAMMELESGERKKAKKLIQKGLITPTENTLAQVFWAKENRHLPDGFNLDQLVRKANYAYEADYHLSLVNGNLKEAMANAQTWEQDEPFATRPCCEQSYIACLLDDYDTTIRMAGRVKKLNGAPDTTLELNAIYARISSGKLNPETDQAEIERIHNQLKNATEDPNAKAPYHAMANLALWHYRFGDPVRGALTYQLAIDIAVKANLKEAAAMAAIFSARESILARSTEAGSLLLQAKALMAQTKGTAGDFYLKKLDALAINPEKEAEILNPDSAERFLKVAPAPVPPFRLERKGSQNILWVKKLNT